MQDRLTGTNKGQALDKIKPTAEAKKVSVPLPLTNLSQAKGDRTMKGKMLITVMAVLLLLSFLLTIAWGQAGGLTQCQNNLSICATNLTNAQTNLGVCTTNLTNAQTTLGVCTTGLADAQTNLGTCQNNAQTSLATCENNLATCQATLSQCVQQKPLTSFPSWDKKLACDSKSTCPRFEVLADWNNEAVLDKETGLVWEQSPLLEDFLDWSGAQFWCNRLTTGGRLGWRLPTLQELASLVDLTQSNPALPAGHPFSNVMTAYWSATGIGNGSSAWTVNFLIGLVSIGPKDDFNSAWCVRGGQGPDVQ